MVSAPAGFGKTTAVSEWVAGCERSVAWLSLDAADSEPARFLTYLTAALQTIAPHIGQGVMGALRSPQPPPIESLLTALLNDITTVPDDFVLVLDDYHVVDAQLDDALAFLLEHLPPRMHLVMTTREDPRLPLSRLRVRGQLAELRATDLRFTPPEAAEFLNQTMGLRLSEDDIDALEARTEGWIAGLQLAAISMRGLDDTTGFITSFTGSHRFVLDYLVEEVLHQQPESVQSFLLRTSILDRFCGPLCDALLLDPSISGQQTLEYLEQINLFIIPLDNERRWYRYHHLFAELLRQRLHQHVTSSIGDGDPSVAELHVRASGWFEAQGLELDAFHHAAAANDVARAERLINGKGMPLYVRGGAAPVVSWLESLPTEVMNARPSLWVMYATALSIIGKLTRVEPALQAAEEVMPDVAPTDETRELIGRIADLRSLVALMWGDPKHLEAVIAHARRALEHLPLDNLRARAAALWRLGLAYEFQGDRCPARRAFTDAIETSESSGNVHINIMATTCLGRLQEVDNHLHPAAVTFRRVLDLVGDPPGPVACEAHVGLARLHYEWNDLDAAQRHGELSVMLAHQVENASFASSELFLARLQLTRGNAAGALAALAKTEQLVRQRNFLFRLPEVVAARVLALLQLGDIDEAARLVRSHDLPMSRARVYLAQGDAAAALTILEPWRQHVVAKGWEDRRLRVMVLQAIAHQAHGDQDTAMLVLGEALARAEPGGFVRLFLDEGVPMARLLSDIVARGARNAYARRLLDALEAQEPEIDGQPDLLAAAPAQPLVDPLSQRELEVLHLIAEGLSNREIGERLFLALNTIKGHNRVIFDKLQVERRTEAVARARELGLL